MADVIVVKLENFCERDKYEFTHLVSENRSEHIKRFRDEKDAYRSYISSLLTYFMLCKKTKRKYNDIKFAFNEYGKPYVENINNSHFNLTHSGEYVVCIIDEVECGIDVEKIESIDLKFVKNYFNIKEYNQIQSFTNANDSLECFYSLWTMKEAYIKALGRGLSKNLNSFYVKRNDNGQFIIIDEEIKNIYKYCINLRLGKNYFLSIVAQSKPRISIYNDANLLLDIKRNIFLMRAQ